MLFKARLPLPNIKMPSAAPPRALVYVLNTFTNDAFPIGRGSRGAVSLRCYPKRAKDERHAREISTQNNRPHIAMSRQLSIRLESVANAHTAADLHVHPWVSKPRWSGKPWASRTTKKYTMGDF